MIRLERAHNNIRNVLLQNTWVDDEAFTRLRNEILALPISVVQFIGACIDEDALPTSLPDKEGAGFSLREYIDLIKNIDGSIEILTSSEIGDIDLIETLYDIRFKKRLLYTVYYSLMREEVALGTGILRLCERLTDGNLLFRDQIETTLYRKIYILLLFRYANFVSSDTWVVFFSSVLFSLAIFMEVAILPALELHIRSTKIVARRESLAMDFAMAMMNNSSLLGNNEQGQSITIGEWASYFNEQYRNISQDIFFEKLEADPKVLANEEALRPLIEMVAFIHRLFISGYFIVEPGSLKSLEKRILQIQKEEQQELLLQKEQAFPDEITQHTADMATWLHRTDALQSLLRWLQTFETKDAGRSAFVTLMQKTVPDISSDMDVAAALVEVDDFLQQNGYGSDDFIYFDEASGAFQYS